MGEPGTYLLAVLVGVIAGAVNTLAGSGSLLTLPMLMALGLPAGMANATNRVGILVQNSVAIAALGRAAGAPDRRMLLALIAPTIFGAGLGAYAATLVSDLAMDRVIAGVLIAAALVALARPKRWLKDSVDDEPVRPWVYLALFVVGLYGGFVQAGVGILLLIALVTGGRLAPVPANLVKLWAVLLFTLPAIGVFAFSNKIDWGLGALLAVGQGLGAFAAARFARKSENAGRWIRYAVVTVALLSAAKILLGPVLG